MADTAVETPVAVTPSKKKGGKAAAAAVKKPKTKPSHPTTAEMVNNAIADMADRRGSSLQAIKKYIVENYKVDIDKLRATFIRRHLIGAVESGELVHSKGAGGVSGYFRIGGDTKAPKKRGPPAKKGVKQGRVTKKKVAPKKPAAATPKKAVAAKKKKAAAASPAKKPKSPKPKSPSKAKKTAKPPTKKPKSPKPKKAAAAKKPAAKKAAAKK